MAKRSPLDKELQELERTEPKVKAAAQSYQQMVKDITEDRKHPMPCTKADCEWHRPSPA